MKFIVALLFSCIFLSAQARLGGLRGNPEGRRDQSHDDSIEVVITFEDDDEDDEDGQRTFKAMSSTFTRLSNDVEVHSMLRNIKMATARVKPAAVADLMNDPRVKAVDLDLVFHQDSVPESPGKSITMAIGNTPIPPFMEDVDGGCQDPGIVKVAIIDGGIDASHPDFSFCGKGFCEGRRFMNPTNQDWGTSTNAHGSHVVGIIAASALDGGFANGMVSDNKICIIIGRVFNNDGQGATLSAVVDALDFAIARGSHIVNMSFGIGSYLPTLHEAVKRLRKNGILAIASSGNSGENKENYPGSFAETMAVAAVDDNKEWASFSTYNDHIDISAPGVGIVSTFPRKQVGSMDGTSMAAPHVAGGAALMKRACMQCTDMDIWDCLISTVEPISCPKSKCGAGFLQVGQAFRCLQQSPCCSNAVPAGGNTGGNGTGGNDNGNSNGSGGGNGGNVEQEEQCLDRGANCTSDMQCCSGKCNRRGKCRSGRRRKNRNHRQLGE